MTETVNVGVPAPEASFDRRLAILLAMAMFVLVVDTSIMNVSISAVVKDLGTTVSGVQSAISLEALVSAAFILIGSKVGDLIGRKRAYVLGLCGYAIGALAMTLAQSLTAVIIFWADHRRYRRLAAAAGRCSRSSTATSRGRHRRRCTPWWARRPPSPLRSGRCSAASSRPTCPGGWRSASRSSSSRSCCPGSSSSATCPTPVPAQVDVGRLDPVRDRHGRPGSRHPGLAGGR